MRSLPLNAALAELIEAAGELLRAELAAGAEVQFELAQGTRGRAGGPALYCYRAMTGQFIGARATALERLPGYPQTASLLAGFDGLERYLASVGVENRRQPTKAAILALLEDVFEEQSDFQPRPERVRAALERLERAAVAGGSEVALIASLHGVTIASPELLLTKGLRIARAETIEGLPEGLGGHDEAERLLVVYGAEDDDAQRALAHGREVLLELLRALRLFGDGRVTLGGLAWARVGGGAWRALALQTRGRPHGMLVVTPEQEDELRAFCNLISRRAPHGNALAWALARFELGCEREGDYDGLSDHLLALRALLEPEGPASGLLAGRLAALCATTAKRTELTERTVRAIALEHDYVYGGTQERAGGRALAAEIAGHLRALLRDVICGHLPGELAALADEILLGEGDSAEQVQGDASDPEEILDLLV